MKYFYALLSSAGFSFAARAFSDTLDHPEMKAALIGFGMYLGCSFAFFLVITLFDELKGKK